MYSILLAYNVVGDTMPSMKKGEKMVTPREYATLKGVAYTTVMNWLQSNRIPGAVKHTTPTGHYWEVPEKAPSPNTRPGRPPKPKTAKASKKKGSKK